MKAKDLKNSILQMAVEGKLVPQHPNDEPASILLERIREEKHRLIAEGKAKFPKGGESVIYFGSDGSPYEKRVDAKRRVLSDKCIADEVPFEELPEGWAWARLETLGILQTGKTPSTQKNDFFNGDIPFITPGDITYENTLLQVKRSLTTLGAQYSRCIRSGSVLQVCIGGSTGKTAQAITGCAFNQQINSLTCCIAQMDGYAFCILTSPVVQNRLRLLGSGTATPIINKSVWGQFLLPIPPLAEQRRIVERVGELMPLVEEYGKLEDVREELDAELPGRLRKSVLQMAVQGKLVPQDPADEPASVLLERIRAHRRQLVAEKKMRAPKGGESVIFRGSDGRRYEKRVDARGRESEPVCIEDEIPFEIPEGWEWARLGSLCDFGACRNIDYRDVAEGVWNLDLEDIEKDSGSIVRKKRKVKGESGSTKHVFASGSVLYSKLRPYLNKVVIADEDGVCSSEILPLNFLGFSNEYAQLVLMEPDFVEYAKGCSYGVKMPRLGVDDGKRWLVAVPPLAEQRRIVAVFRTYTTNAL